VRAGADSSVKALRKVLDVVERKNDIPDWDFEEITDISPDPAVAPPAYVDHPDIARAAAEIWQPATVGAADEVSAAWEDDSDIEPRIQEPGGSYATPWEPAARSAVCIRCGRALRSERSIAAGMGPVCANKM
jgi:hypothetical protein